jgi:hypothetical protein
VLTTTHFVVGWSTGRGRPILRLTRLYQVRLAVSRLVLSLVHCNGCVLVVALSALGNIVTDLGSVRALSAVTGAASLVLSHFIVFRGVDEAG